MNSFLGLENIPETAELRSRPDVHSTPRLLLDLEPWGRTFWRNLGDMFLRRKQPAIYITSPPAAFWHDVFVPQRMPWGAFVESILYHLIVVAVALGISSLLPPERHVVQVRRFDPRDAIYYSPSEFLPPIDTGSSQHAQPIQGDPEFARQSILSVPPESDNRHQTIVTPPDIRINHDIETPNIVAWGDHSVPVPGAAVERKTPSVPVLPNQIVAPVPAVDQRLTRSLASLEQRIVAPPPEVQNGARAVAALSIDVVAPSPDANVAGQRRAFRGPEAAVVEPPPATDAASVRKPGDLNIGRSEVIAPAPRLPLASQRALSELGTEGRAVVPPPPSMEGSAGGKATPAARSARVEGMAGGSDGQVIPPPPSVPGPRSADAGGRIIALGIHPSVAPPPEPPQGNRRGTFAASPQGKAGAPGTPDLRADSSSTDGFKAGKNGASSGPGSGGSAAGAPPGLHVGPGSTSATAATAGGDPAGNGQSAKGETPGHAEIAEADLPHTRTSSTPHAKADLVENPTPLERQIFRDRRLYSMTMNMPNLNSAGGSWVMRFAELGEAREKGELIAPIAEHKVDPAYPLQLMRENVSGTVTLRAIIRADGSVSDIRVVNGADSRLDHYASEALAKWHFLPAMKNDSNVDVEAIVMIPFKPILKRSQF